MANTRVSAPGVFCRPPTPSERHRRQDPISSPPGRHDRTAGVHRGDFRPRPRGAPAQALVGTMALESPSCGEHVPERVATVRTCAHPSGVFSKKGPASTLIQVAALAHPDYLIEIEAIAVV